MMLVRDVFLSWVYPFIACYHQRDNTSAELANLASTPSGANDVDISRQHKKYTAAAVLLWKYL